MKALLITVPIAVVGVLAACGGSSSSSPTPAPTGSSETSTLTVTGTPAPSYQAKVVIDPTTGKVGSVIHVQGSGYSPNVTVTGTICAVNAQGQVDNPLTDCDVVDTVSVTTDANGNFTADYTIKRIPPAKAMYTIGFGVRGDPSNSAGAVITIQQ